jgi:hypothetical protein
MEKQVLRPSIEKKGHVYQHELADPDRAAQIDAQAENNERVA